MDNKGFTLIEMMVAVAIFTLLISAGSGIFISFIRVQRQSLATQEVLDQTSYLMEYMSRAIRMAKKDIDGDCTLAAKLNYYFDGQCLKFINSQDECQEFCLEDGTLKDENENNLTSDTLTVSSFDIDLAGENQLDDEQPKVTIFLEIQGREQSAIKIQTTISQRNPDVQK